MCQYDKLKLLIESAVLTQQGITETVKSFVQDIEIDLDLRWEIFIQAGEAGFIPSEGYYFKPKGLNWDMLTLYDDFHIDKYQHYQPDGMLETIEDSNIEHNITDFKESWLEKFVFQVENDW